jgi:hypothetical protein
MPPSSMFHGLVGDCDHDELEVRVGDIARDRLLDSSDTSHRIHIPAFKDGFDLAVKNPTLGREDRRPPASCGRSTASLSNDRLVLVPVHVDNDDRSQVMPVSLILDPP